MICLLFASDDVIPGKHNQTARPWNSLLNVQCWQPIAQKQIGITINVEVGY